MGPIAHWSGGLALLLCALQVRGQLDIEGVPLDPALYNEPYRHPDSRAFEICCEIQGYQRCAKMRDAGGLASAGQPLHTDGWQNIETAAVLKMKDSSFFEIHDMLTKLNSKYGADTPSNRKAVINKLHTHGYETEAARLLNSLNDAASTPEEDAFIAQLTAAGVPPEVASGRAAPRQRRERRRTRSP